MQTLRLPKAAKAMDEGTVEEWHVEEGASLSEGRELARVRTPDAEVTLKSGCEGVLRKILAPPGTAVRVGAPLAVVADDGEDIEEAVAKLTEELDGGAPPANAAPSPTARPRDKSEESKMDDAGTNGDGKAGAPSAQVTPVLMPQVGNTMEEGTIVAWRVAEGDTIEQGQILFEVETDKATVEVEATDAGRLARIVANEGDVVPIKKPVAYLAEKDADVDAYLDSQGAAGATETPGAKPAPEAKSAAPAGPEGDVTPVLMPQVGNTMEEGTIVAWRVAEGDTIEQGQIIFDVETDKATVEVEATDAGRLARIVAGEDDVVPVKQPVAYLADDDADVDAYIASQGGATQQTAASPGPAAPKPAPAPTAAPSRPAATTAGGRVKASPAARKLAAERGIDLAAIGAGSGVGGRIITKDVASAKPGAAPAATGAMAVGEPIRHELTSMRKAIGGALLRSKQTIPHFYATMTIDAGPLYDAYQRLKAAAEFKVSINDLVVRACVLCMREFPAFRSRLDDGALIEYPAVNIGVAVGTDDGLLVPVVRRAGEMNLERLAGETRRVVEGARNGKLEGIGEGLMTVTNLGMFGVHEFGAIINPPEASILAVGAVREDVIVENGAIRAGRVMSMTLSADHRIVDGVLGAQFLARMKELLEAPEELTT